VSAGGVGLSLRLGLRQLHRDWRAGELRVLAAAVLIAVTSVTAVAVFTDRIAQALDHQTAELLGADLRLISDHPLPEAVEARAGELGLKTAHTRALRSMIIAGEGDAERVTMAEVKAVSDAYPLRGRLRVAASRFAPDAETGELPRPGQVWVEARLLQKTGLSVGDHVQVGRSRLRIAQVLSYEPDRSGDMFSIAPRLLMRLQDLPATGLVQEGSRLHYGLLLAGEPAAVARFRSEWTPKLQRGERFEGAADARREVRVALERAQQFLGLAAVVAVLLACVAIAMAARRFAQRHLDGCAILRCFGARQRQISGLFLTQLLTLGLLAGALGVLLGYAAQWVLANLLGTLVLVELPAPSLWPVLVGMGVAFGGLLGFALPPILQLREVPTLRVLRREQGGLRPASALSYLAGVVALAGLVLFQSGGLSLGSLMLLGVAGAALVLWLVAAAMIWALKRGLHGGGVWWRFGLANITRRPAAAIAQVMAFGLGIMVLLLLSVVRGDLLQGWAQGLADDAPNRFVVNIQPDQVAAVREFFAGAGPAEPPQLFPMVRGRLMAINGTPVNEALYRNPRARVLVEREFNLSWAGQLQADNAITAGRWWRAEDVGEPLFSVEQGLAKTLGIAVGDRLSYRIAGDTFTATVTSLRSVRWDSFQANFYIIAPPGVLDSYPVSYMTSFYLPPQHTALLDRLVKRFPNLTIIDIAAIMDQVRMIIDRVSLAVEYVFAFTLAAGLTVMYAAIQTTLSERLHENAILRALGARRRRLWLGLAAEFVVLGSLAGLLAAFIANLLGHAVAHFVLELDYTSSPLLWLAGLVLGGAGVGIAGIIGTRRVVNSPPLAVLRDG